MPSHIFLSGKTDVGEAERDGWIKGDSELKGEEPQSDLYSASRIARSRQVECVRCDTCVAKLSLEGYATREKLGQANVNCSMGAVDTAYELYVKLNSVH